GPLGPLVLRWRPSAENPGWTWNPEGPNPVTHGRQRIPAMCTHSLRSIVLFAPLFAASLVFPQASGLGLKGGPLLSDTHSGASRSGQLPGASIGLYFSLHAGARLELQPEFVLTAL